MRTVRGGMVGSACVVVAVALLGGWLAATDARSGGHAQAATAGGRCILCNAFGADKAPRICTSCNNKFNNRCILCNAFGADKAPRICNSCGNKFNDRCILCNAFGANNLPRICTSCNNKH